MRDDSHPARAAQRTPTATAIGSGDIQEASQQRRPAPMGWLTRAGRLQPRPLACQLDSPT